MHLSDRLLLSVDYDLQPKQRPRLDILCKDAQRLERLSKLTGLIGSLAFSDHVEVRRPVP